MNECVRNSYLISKYISQKLTIKIRNKNSCYQQEILIKISIDNHDGQAIIDKSSKPKSINYIDNIQQYSSKLKKTHPFQEHMESLEGM